MAIKHETSGLTPFQLSIARKKILFLKPLLTSLDASVIQTVLETPIEKDNSSLHSNTPLHLLASLTDASEVETALLERFNTLNSTDQSKVLSLKNDKGNTPLHEAIIKNKPELAAKLLESIDNLIHTEKLRVLTAKNNEGNTPLHEAIINKKPELAAKLLESIENLSPSEKLRVLTAKNNEGKTPLQLALSKQNIGSANAIFEKIKECDSTVETAFTNLNALLTASVSTNKPPTTFYETIKFFDNPDLKNASETLIQEHPNILILAVQTGVPKLVEKVLVLSKTSKGQLLQPTSESENSLTPLALAVENDKIDIVKVIRNIASYKDYSKALSELVKTALTSAPPKIDIAVELFDMIRDKSNAVDPAKQMSENEEPMAFKILHQLFILDSSTKKNIMSFPNITRPIVRNHVTISNEEIEFLRQLNIRKALPQKDRGPLKAFLIEYDQRHLWLEK